MIGFLRRVGCHSFFAQNKLKVNRKNFWVWGMGRCSTLWARAKLGSASLKNV
jgi:hypothetical protein